jgi:hypothetical protein
VNQIAERWIVERTMRIAGQQRRPGLGPGRRHRPGIAANRRGKAAEERRRADPPDHIGDHVVDRAEIDIPRNEGPAPPCGGPQRVGVRRANRTDEACAQHFVLRIDTRDECVGPIE